MTGEFCGVQLMKAGTERSSSGRSRLRERQRPTGLNGVQEQFMQERSCLRREELGQCNSSDAQRSELTLVVGESNQFFAE